MATIEVPPDVYPRVRAVEERVQPLRERDDWGGILAEWLELARAYPHDEWPVRILVAEYQSAGDHTRSAWVDVGTQAHQAHRSVPGNAVAQREFLSDLQHRIAVRLEALARHRGIRVWRWRRVRSGSYLVPNLVWVPWGGVISVAAYVHTVLPTHLPYRPTGRRLRSIRWRFPGYAFVIQREPNCWYPALFARLVACHLVAMRQRHRLNSANWLLTTAVLEPPSLPGRLSRLRQAGRRSRELPTPLEALWSPAGTAAMKRLEEAILVYFIRREIRLMQAS